MKNEKGGVVIWFALLVAPVLLIALFALIDFNQWRNKEYQLKTTSTRAIEWSLFKNQNSLVDEFDIYSYDSAHFNEVFIDEWKLQYTEDEVEGLPPIGVEEVRFEKPLDSLPVIKEIILETQYLDYSVNTFNKLMEFTKIADLFKNLIDQIFRLLDVAQAVEKWTQEFNTLSSEYKTLVQSIPSNPSAALRALSLSMLSVRNEIISLEEQVNEIELALKQQNIPLEKKQQWELKLSELYKLKAEQELNFSELQNDIQRFKGISNRLKTFLVDVKVLTDEIFAILEEIDELIIGQEQENKQESTLTNSDQFANGTISSKSFKDYWETSFKFVKAAKSGLDAFVDQLEGNVTLLDNCINDLNAILSVVDFSENHNYVIPLIRFPLWPKVEGSQLLELGTGEPISGGTLQEIQKWLDIQNGIDLSVVEKIYGGEIPLDKYNQLPSQTWNLSLAAKETHGNKDTMEDDGVNLANAHSSTKRLKETSRLWQTLISTFNNQGTALLEKSIIGDYVLEHMPYNVPSKFEDEQQFLGQVEYILIGSPKAAINAGLVDAQIGSMRIGMNAIALLVREQETLQWLGTQLAAISGGISYPVTYCVVLAGWSVAESLADMHSLHEGKEVELCKLVGDFTVELDAKFLLQGHDSVTENTEQFTKAKEFLKEEFSIKWRYEDYLRLLLLIQDEDVLLLRIADIWQLASENPLKDHFTQVSMIVNQPYSGVIFRRGQMKCQITYNFYKGVLVE